MNFLKYKDAEDLLKKKNWTVEQALLVVETEYRSNRQETNH